MMTNNDLSKSLCPAACPRCGVRTRVERTEQISGQIRRMRVCPECLHAFWTREVMQEKKAAT